MTINPNCKNSKESVVPTTALEPNGNQGCRVVGGVEPSFNLSDFLPEEIAAPLKQVAEAMPTSPEALLTTLLAACASLGGTAVGVQPISLSESWKEPSILWAMIIAPTGSKKSSTMDTLVNPLLLLEDEINKNSEEPIDLVVSDFTIEALMKVLSKNKRGPLAYRDELAGLFKSLNKYRKGDDLEILLSLNSGKAAKVNRIADNYRLKLGRTALSIVGSIQCEVLGKYLTDDNIASGFLPRWLLCSPLMPPAKFTGKKCPDVSKVLLKLYSRLIQIQHGSTFRFSKEAETLFIHDWYDCIGDSLETEKSINMKAILGKWQGYCARIALVLHCIEESCKLENTIFGTDVELPLEISSRTVEKAISLSKYYIAQAELVYGIRRELENSLPEVWVILEKLSKEKGGWIKARVACQKTKNVKNADNCRLLFRQMAKAGFGQIRGEGKNLEWRYSEPTGIASTLLQNAASIAA